MTVTRTNRAWFSRFPLNNITPFTYRDGFTFLEALEDLRRYVTGNLLEDINALIDAINEGVEGMEEEFTDQINLFVARLETEIERFNTEFSEKASELQGDYNEFTEAISVLVDSISNKTGSWGHQFVTLTAPHTVDVNPLWPTDHPIVFRFTQNSVGGHGVSFGPGISDHWGTVIRPEPGAVSTVELYPVPGGGWTVRQNVVVDAREANLSTATNADNRAALNELFARSNHVVFPVYAEFFFNADTAPLVIPENTTVEFNGCQLNATTATDKDSIRIDSNVVIDNLNYRLVNMTPVTRGIHIAGSNVDIGLIDCSAPGSSGSGSFLRRVINVGSEGVPARNVRIERVRTDNFDFSLGIWAGENITVDDVQITRARQGIMIRDAKNVRINGGYFRGDSPNASGTPGENAVIIEAVAAPWAVDGVYVTGFTCQQAGEHGFRVGGQLPARNIHFDKCHAAMTGAGGHGQSEPNNHGGCGFKVLGATTNDENSMHENIYFTNCSVGKLARSRNKDNFAGFNVGKSRHVVIDNPIVSARVGETGEPAYNGIEMIGAENVVITNPQIRGVVQAGIELYSTSNTQMINWGKTINVTVEGGVIENCMFGIRIRDIVNEPLRRVNFNNVLITGCLRGISQIAGVADNMINRCSFTGKIFSSERVTENTGAWYMDIWYEPGSEQGDNFIARQGSMRTGFLTGIRQIRRASTWEEL